MKTASRFDTLAAQLPGFGSSPAEVRVRVEAMEKLLEGLFVIPGINRRIGLDSIVGLVPVAGDLVTGAMGMWIVWEARNLGMSRWTMARMTANVGIDTALGAIPFVGDLFDFVFKSNRMNLKLIKSHLDRHHPATMTVAA